MKNILGASTKCSAIRTVFFLGATLFFLIACTTAPAQRSLSAQLQAPDTPTPTGAVIAALSELLNDVQMRASGTQNFSAAVEGQDLFADDQVRTGRDSRARVDFADRSIVRLDQSSLLTIKAPVANTDAFSRALLALGKVWVSVFGGSVEIETPVGVASVRGSFAIVDFNRARNTLTVGCIEGDCRIRTSGRTIQLGNLERVTTNASGQTIERAALTAQDVNAFIAENPEATVVARTLTAAPTQTFTALPTATATFIPTQTDTPVPSPTIMPTATETISPSAVPSDTPVPPSPRPPREPTDTPVASSTFTPTRVPSYTPTYTPTRAPTQTFTPTQTHTPTSTHTPTHTSTPSPTPVTARILCVDVNANPVGAPCNNATAFTSIDAALAAAQPNDEIRLKNGIYTGTGAAVVTLTQSVKLIGGFPGGVNGWTTPDQTNLSILDGETVRPALSIPGTSIVMLENLTLRNGGIDAPNAMVKTDAYALRLENGTTQTHFEMGAAGAVEFVSGTHTLQGGTTFAGSGTAKVYTATVALAGNLNAEAFNMQSGKIQGTGALMITREFVWRGGTLILGTLDIASTGHLKLASDADKLLYGSQLILNGTTYWTDFGNVYLDAGANIINRGRFEILNNAGMLLTPGASAQIKNEGTLIKLGGNGTTKFGMPFENRSDVIAQTGTFDFTGGFVQTNGRTSLEGGNLYAAGVLELQRGTLQGLGFITANVSNAGRIIPGISVTTPQQYGILHINGSYTQTISGTLQVAITGLTATPTNSLKVNGDIALRGTLDIRTAAAYTPVAGDHFVVLAHYARTGVFDTILGEQISPTFRYNVTYETADVALNPVALFAAQEKLARPAQLTHQSLRRAIKLVWQPNAHATHYALQIRRGTRTGENIRAQNALDVAAYRFVPDDAGTYLARVRACNANGCSAWSAWHRFTWKP